MKTALQKFSGEPFLQVYRSLLFPVSRLLLVQYGKTETGTGAGTICELDNGIKVTQFKNRSGFRPFAQDIVPGILGNPDNVDDTTYMKVLGIHPVNPFDMEFEVPLGELDSGRF